MTSRYSRRAEVPAGRPPGARCYALPSRAAAGGCSAEVSEAHHKEIWPPQDHRGRWALLLSRGNERGRHQRSTRGWPTAQQSGRELPSAISTARAGRAAVSRHEDPAKIQFNSRAGPRRFNQERHLVNRDVCNQRRSAALAEWSTLAA